MSLNNKFQFRLELNVEPLDRNFASYLSCIIDA